MEVEILKQIGLEEKEARIYHTLLKLGPSPASKVATELGYERTTTYYLLLRMLERGFVSETVKGNVKTFAAAEPKHVLHMLRERENMFATILPQLQRMSEQREKQLAVEVRQGKEGFKHLYRDAVLVGQDVYGLGVDDGQYFDLDTISFEQYYRDAEAAGIKEKLITFEGARTFGSPISEYRVIAEEYFQPTPIIIYGDRIVLISWEPTVHLVFIYSNELANAFRKHFELLWKIAKTIQRNTEKQDKKRKQP